MMKRLAAVVLALGAMAMMAGVASANVITLTFEGLQDEEPILNYYNGGTGGFGSGPGPNYGIAFSSDSLALISYTAGGSGNFTNAPSGDTIAFFLSGAGDTMNVAAGFTTGFSFYYAAAYDGSVSVYSGPDGTGTLLANLALPATPNPYTQWVPIGVSFAGTAESVIFSGAANYIGFDDITLGASLPPGATPEPSACLIALVGGLGFAGYGWRRRRLAAKVA